MLQDVTLAGRHVVLEPLRVEHAARLADAVGPGDDVWTWMPAEPRGEAQMRAWIEARLGPRPGLGAYAFLQRHPATGAAMGSTSLFDVDPAGQCAEIGFTWLAAPYRRTGANTEAKRLLLGFAFETLGLRRVQLVTDVHNQRSRTAIERLGATREGVLRNWRRRRDGSLRDSVVYSLLDREWADVRARLDALLGAH